MRFGSATRPHCASFSSRPRPPTTSELPIETATKTTIWIPVGSLVSLSFLSPDGPTKPTHTGVGLRYPVGNPHRCAWVWCVRPDLSNPRTPEWIWWVWVRIFVAGSLPHAEVDPDPDPQTSVHKSSVSQKTCRAHGWNTGSCFFVMAPFS
jgi:hypothetical protein